MPLPDRPNLRHLRDQAKDLVRSGAVRTLADAQLQIARQYGFASWAKLKHQVESLNGTGRLRQAIASNDLARVEELLASKPGLRQVLIDDVPLQAQAQPGRTPMMELLVHHGADVNGLCWGWFPVLFTPCENLEPEPLQWLLDHGADPNRGNPRDPGTALDYVIQTYPRHPERLSACIELLLAAGGHTRYDLPCVLALLRGRTGDLALLDADPTLLQAPPPGIGLRPVQWEHHLAGRNPPARRYRIRLSRRDVADAISPPIANQKRRTGDVYFTGLIPCTGVPTPML